MRRLIRIGLILAACLLLAILLALGLADLMMARQGNLYP